MKGGSAVGFKIDGVDELIQDLGSIDGEKMAYKMLEEATPVVEKAVKRHASAHKRTGDMHKSIKSTGVKQSKDGGLYTVVRPTGKDKKGVRNMDKAMYLEFGTSVQNATPIILPAVEETREIVLNKMQEAFDREMGQIDRV